MLVLSRKQAQSIVIGNGTKITILKVQGGRVRLGIEAPREVPVRREELDRPVSQGARSDQRQ